MKQKELDKLTFDELKKKEKSIKIFIGFFILIILALLFFIFDDYFAGEKIEFPILIITITSIGGLVSLFPTLKTIKKILNEKE